jgi:hypothetical protein
MYLNLNLTFSYKTSTGTDNHSNQKDSIFKTLANVYILIKILTFEIYNHLHYEVILYKFKVIINFKGTNLKDT